MWRGTMIFCYLSIASLAAAETVTYDAFGAYTGVDGFRDDWGGVSVRCVEEDCETIDIRPENVDEISIYVGQKTLRVGQDQDMIFALLQDGKGSLVKDGLPVTLYWENRRYQTTALTKNGVAYHIFDASNIAGRFEASATARELQSARQLYVQNSDIREFQPQVRPDQARAIEGDLVTISSPALTDQYGNRGELGLTYQAVLYDENANYIQFPLMADGNGLRAAIYANYAEGQINGALATVKGDVPIAFEIAPANLLPPSRMRGFYNGEKGYVSLEIYGLRTDAEKLVRDAMPFDMTIKTKTGKMLNERVSTLDGAILLDLPLEISDFPISIIGNSEIGEFNEIFNLEMLEPSWRYVTNARENLKP